MTQTTTMTVRLPRDVIDRLEALARATDRTKSYLAGRAIEVYLEQEDWQVNAIEQAVAEANAPGARYYEHGEIKERIAARTRDARGQRK